MTRRYVTERRKQHRELSALDRRNRCAECKVDLSTVAKTYEVLGSAVKFCSPGCRDQHMGIER